MKRLLFILLIAFFIVSILKTDSESNTYVDFDDIDLPEVVVV